MTGRDRMLIIVLATAAVLGGFWFLALSPKRAESARLDAQVAAARTELADASAQTATAVQAQRSYGADTAAVAMLGKAVPEDQQTDALLYQLDAAAGGSKVRLTSITPATIDPAAAPSTLPGGVTEMALSLAFEGRFPDLERFLRRVHGATSFKGDAIDVHGRLLSVTGVQLTPDPLTGEVEAVVTASAFVAPPTAATAAAAPGATATAPPTTASTAPPTQAAVIGAGG